MLGIYTYPQQVLFCARPFLGLQNVKRHADPDIVRQPVGIRHRLRRHPGQDGVLLKWSAPFARGVVDCAITGTLSGNEIGLIDVASHIHPIAITRFVSFRCEPRLLGEHSSDLQTAIRNAR